MADKIDLQEENDKILISAKIEQALEESWQGLGEDCEDFKAVFLKRDTSDDTELSDGKEKNSGAAQ